MNFNNHTIVLCHGLRTPFGALGKRLTDVPAEEMMLTTFKGILERSRLAPDQVDGVFVGWVGEDSHATNIARVTALRLGLPPSTPALTLQANCVAGMEAVCSAVSRLIVGDGDLFLVGGAESMSRVPYAIRGSRGNPFLRSLETIKTHWAELFSSPEVSLIDMVEEALTDPVARINVGATAEVLAQIFKIDRAAQDRYATESVRRAVAATQRGFYAGHLLPVTHNGTMILDHDETPVQRSAILEKPKLMEKAPVLFDNSLYSLRDFYRDHRVHLGRDTPPEGSHGTVTLLNACGRSDGAAGVIVTTAAKAKSLGLDVMAEVGGWAFRGVVPERMGLAPAVATTEVLKRVGISFDQLDAIELHEPFAACTLALFQFAKETYGQDWSARFEDGRLNPEGGSLALGHPIAATGIRLLLNLAHSLKSSPKNQWGLAGMCASGGMGGAMVLRNTVT